MAGERRAILHIGGEKTGTTSIQAFCASNRLALASRGILYPAALGRSNHLRLAAYAVEDEIIDENRLMLGVRTVEELGAYRADLEHKLAQEIAGARNTSTLLVSSEHLQSRLVHLSEVERLKRFIDRFANSVQILVYLRRQDRLAGSYYSTRLKASIDDGAEIFPEHFEDPAVAAYYDYDAMLRRFEAVFGQSNIIVRIFEADRLLEGDLLADFRFHAGISEGSDLATVKRENESLSEIGMGFYRQFNKVAPRFIDGKPNRMRAGLNEAMMAGFAGAGPRAPRADAEAFYARWREGNRAVKARYFPDLGGELFNEDFSVYDHRPGPDEGGRSPYDVAVHLWMERSRKIQMLELENVLLKYMISRKEGSTRKAPKLPDVDDIHDMPDFLMMRYIGALLSAGEFRRAADTAGPIVETRAGRPALALALGLALLHLDDEAAFDALLSRRGGEAALGRALVSLRRSGVAGEDYAAWSAALKDGDALQSQLYKRCLAWLEE